MLFVVVPSEGEAATAVVVVVVAGAPPPHSGQRENAGLHFLPE